jgi:RimJ/RimL family protein N-acetyltransferase
MGDGPIVRRLRAEDAGALMILRREALETVPLAFAASVEDDRGLDRELVERSLAAAGEEAVFGHFDGGELTGMVGLVRLSKLKQRHQALLWGMYVSARARRRGAGRALVDAAIRQAREWGVDQVELGVTEAAPAAKRVYEAAGFRTWGHQRRSLGWQGRFVDEDHMALDLGPPADSR